MTDKADVQDAQRVPRSGDLQIAVAAATEMFRAANPKSLAGESDTGRKVHRFRWQAPSIDEVQQKLVKWVRQ